MTDKSQRVLKVEQQFALMFSEFKTNIIALEIPISGDEAAGIG